jgi:predicted lipoprotein with Yx(FWY)xxD motif
MKKSSQKGFSAIEGVLVVVIIAIVAFVVWYVFHTKNNTNNIYGNAANTQTTVPPASNKTSTSTSAKPIIQTKTDSKLGKYLADGNGKPLYTYSQDTANTSNCTGSCLTNWPAYKAASSLTSLPTNVGTITRSDGGVQYTYNKKPLYYFSGDTGSTITGNGVEGFSVATP